MALPMKSRLMILPDCDTTITLSGKPAQGRNVVRR
jgi:hypothetical protein